jgi:hypothetical protein
LRPNVGTPRFAGQSERSGGHADRDDHAEAEDEAEQQRAARVGSRHQGVDAAEDEGE